jgi:two-component system, NtrC family, response regulator HydG
MRHVLIVDDDRDHAESLADVLEMRGHEVAVCYSGEEAVERFRGGNFDFVLLDIKLPGIDGLETFLQMKKLRPGARVMMMTGYSLEQIVAQAIEGGALGVLNKPFAATQLLDVLAQLKPKSTVLVADDDPDFVDSIEPILEMAGYEVAIAGTGTDALQLVLKGGIDCLILDLHLPGMSGTQVYAHLIEAGRSVPTVLVTGGATDAQGEAQLGGGCDVLYKPFDPRSLLAAVGAAVPGAAAAK